MKITNAFVAALIVALLPACAANKEVATVEQSAPANIDYRSELVIEGDEDFTQKTRAALELLHTTDPELTNFIARYVKRIKQSQRSGMAAYETPPTFYVGAATANASRTWYASTIVHDSYHSYLYFEALAKSKDGEVEQDQWAGFEAERQCNAFQLKAMKAFNAPEHEIQHLLSQDGTHGDINGDGVLDGDDYRARDW
ncbi:hypothetical protein ACVBEJ_02040 [Porticoccus sp. GXU_MW_L64]